MLSRVGLKGNAVFSKICAVAVDLQGDEVFFSLMDGPALLELSAAPQAEDALVLSVNEGFIRSDSNKRQGRTGWTGAKGLTAVAMFRTPRTHVTGRWKFAGPSKQVFVNLGDAKARRL